ncbi:MAG: DUF1318 domain-containing protein [Methyloprofundus sp.]|nr:DUF1318 domain-containing protein [Methyloprofundus sp.]
MKKVPLLSMLFLTACVTINIYFPAAAAEEVADEIIQDIQSVVPEENFPDELKKSQLKPKSEFSQWQVSFYQFIDKAIASVVSSAHAEANLSADSADIRRIKASMRSRFSQLKSYYDKGTIGIKSDGLLTTKGKVSLKDRNKVNKLIKSENSDRNKLYKAVAAANGHPEWAGQIKSTFASSWVSNAQSGWWYQSSNGKWKKK